MAEPKQPALVFPLPFSLKVMGKNEADFDRLVLSLMSNHIPGLDMAALTIRPSTDGNFVSITIPFVAESREQLDAIYRELSQNERVLMVL
ncbi:MAG TPA: DUF493 domain-containing protein [Anaerolineales bacterium]